MYQLLKLTEVPGLVHGMSELWQGNQSFRYVRRPAEARAARSVFRRYLEKLPGGYPLFMPGNGVAMRPAFNPPLLPTLEIRVARFHGDDRGCGMFTEEDEMRAEALVTQDRGLFFFLTVADCLPVVLFDPVTRTLALAHVSRVTVILRLIKDHGEPVKAVPPLLSRLIDFLSLKYGVKAGDVIAAIGPGISKESYELEWFDGAHRPEWKSFLAVGAAGRIRVDLAGFSRWLLESKGVLPENIEVSGLDTVTARDEEGILRFFSHRRAAMNGETEGRNAFVVGMPLEE